MQSVSAGRALGHVQLLKRVCGIGHTGGRGASAHTVKQFRR